MGHHSILAAALSSAALCSGAFEEVVSVRVLRADGAPAEHARLFVFAPSTLEEGRRRRYLPMLDADPAALARAHGREFRADASGVLELDLEALERVDDKVLVLAEGPGGSRMGVIGEPRPRELRLSLAPPRRLEVIVTSGGGQPVAGAPVVLNLREEPNGELLPVRRTITDAAGRARFEDLEQHRSVFRLQAARTGELEVALGIAMLDRPRAPVPDAAESEVRFVMPSVASLVVDARFLGDDLEGLVVLSPATQAVSWWLSQHADVAPLVGGRATFEFVPPGDELRAKVQFPGDLTVFGRCVPAVSGSELVVSDPSARRLQGRLLDSSGQPLRDTALDLRLEDASGRSTRLRPTRTDGSGRFRCLVRQDAHPSRFHLSPPAHLPLGAAQVELEAGRVELGDVVLQPLVTLAAGRVLDPAGEPIAGARVRTRYSSTAASGGKPGPSYRDLSAVITDGEGRFEVLAETRVGALRLEASHPDHVHGGVHHFDGGDGDIELRLRRAGKVRIAAPRPEAWRDLSGMLELRVTLPNGESDDIALMGDVGSYVFPHLPPGSCRVSVLFEDVELFGRDVEVEAGAISQLGEVSLLGLAEPALIELFDHEGEPLDPGEVWLQLEAGNMRRVVRSVDRQRARYRLLVPTGGTLKLWTQPVGNEGVPRCRTEAFEVSGDGALRLAPPMSLQVRLLEFPELPEGVRIGIEMRQDGRFSAWPSEVAALDPEGDLLVFPMNPGEHAIQWFLWREALTRLVLPLATTVEVEDVSERQDLDLLLSRDELDAIRGIAERQFGKAPALRR